jgi:hypothetical protein
MQDLIKNFEFLIGLIVQEKIQQSDFEKPIKHFDDSIKNLQKAVSDFPISERPELGHHIRNLSDSFFKIKSRRQMKSKMGPKFIDPRAAIAFLWMLTRPEMSSKDKKQLGHHLQDSYRTLEKKFGNEAINDLRLPIINMESDEIWYKQVRQNCLQTLKSNPEYLLRGFSSDNFLMKIKDSKFEDLVSFFHPRKRKPYKRQSNKAPGKLDFDKMLIEKV